jgi:hypothetical protein
VAVVALADQRLLPSSRLATLASRSRSNTSCALLLVDGADRSLVLLGDGEHCWSMRAEAEAYKPRDGLSVAPPAG